MRKKKQTNCVVVYNKLHKIIDSCFLEEQLVVAVSCVVNAAKANLIQPNLALLCLERIRLKSQVFRYKNESRNYF